MPITHQDIAEKMGISRTLVTKALHRSNGTRVSDETRDAIQSVAAQMGYAPRGLTTHTIGYVVSVESLRLEAVTNFLMEVQRALAPFNYRLTLADFDDDCSTQALSTALSPKAVDGVLCTGWHNGKIRSALSPEVPWLLISDEDGVNEDVDLVATDVAQTLRNVTDHLIAHGHRRICLIVGESNIKYHRLIKRGALRSLTAAGLPETNLTLLQTRDTEQTEVRSHRPLDVCLLEILQKRAAPTAVIAANPGQAFPALYALRAAGYRVPEDISMVSVVDAPVFKALRPALTTTTAFDERHAHQVARRIIEKIQNPTSPARRILLAGEVVERESVGCAASAPKA